MTEIAIPAAEHEALLEFLYLCPIGVVECSGSGEILKMNPKAAQLLLPVAGANLENLFTLLDFVAPGVSERLSLHLESGTACEGYRFSAGTATGANSKVLAMTLIRVADSRVMAVFQDVTEMARQEIEIRERDQKLEVALAKLQESHRFQEQILKTTPNIVYVYDLIARRNLWVNQEITAVLGYSRTEINETGELLARIIHADDLPRVLRHYAAICQGADGEIRELEYRTLHRDQTWRWLLSRDIAFKRNEEGSVVQILGTAIDITDRKLQAEQLAYHACVDALTNLPNRRRFLEQLDSALTAARSSELPFTVAVADLDRFKQINDNHGHAAGDRVLSEFGRIVRKELRARDLVGRIGGDEFCFAFPETSVKDARNCLERIRREFAALDFNGKHGGTFQATVTIGLTGYRGEMNQTMLIESADHALYAAKENGRNQLVTSVP